MTTMDAQGCIESLHARIYDGTAWRDHDFPIVRETILEVFVNGGRIISLACTGHHLDELAVGFLRSEGIVTDRKAIGKIEVDDAGKRVFVETVSPVPLGAGSDRFSKAIAASGARSSSLGQRGLRKDPSRKSEGRDRLSQGLPLSAATVRALMEELLASAPLHEATHGTHCAGLAEPGGLICSREDIGRHNTIDMLGGYALLGDLDCSEKIILTTGRVSAEIVLKVWNLGIPVIISHSAPTSRAVELLRQAGITLVGHVRRGKMNLYTDRNRMIF